MVTSLPLASYFDDPLFLRYMGNVVGHISFFLPGVFETNPVDRIVNVNLWTLPGEFYCYLFMAAAMISRLAYSRTGWIAIGIAATAALAVALAFTYVSTRVNSTHFSTTMIIYYFIVGCVLYEFSDRIQLDIRLFCGAIAAYYLITLLNIGDIFGPIFLTYAIVFVGCQRFPAFDKSYRVTILMASISTVSQFSRR